MVAHVADKPPTEVGEAGIICRAGAAFSRRSAAGQGFFAADAAPADALGLEAQLD